MSLLEQHINTFVNYFMPSGKPFAAKHVIGSNLRLLVEGMCTEFYEANRSIEELINEMLPDTTTEYIDRWESVVGIPGGCFNRATDIETRRLNIKRKLSLLGLQTSQDFVAFAAALGVDIAVNSGIDHDSTNGYGSKTPDITFGSAKEARFTIVVKIVSSTNAFDYTFDFPFQTAEEALVQCVFTHAKPANCNILFVAES